MSLFNFFVCLVDFFVNRILIKFYNKVRRANSVWAAALFILCFVFLCQTLPPAKLCDMRNYHLMLVSLISKLLLR